VFNNGTGVDHHAWQEAPTEWTPASPIDDLMEGRPVMADCDIRIQDGRVEVRRSSATSQPN
jgi:hypothetical protein